MDLIYFVMFGRDMSVRRYLGLKQQAEASPVIGANAAFNNRTKEELEMHMF